MSLRHAIGAQTLRRCEAPGRGVALAAVFLWSGCIVDEGDQRCDANQVVVKGSGFTGETCGCAAGAVPDPKGYGCTLCGANEVVSNGKCACGEGYARTSDTGPCEKALIGAACTGDEGCSGQFPDCATDGAERYCSVKNCSATSCPTGYACEQANGTSFCAKLPARLNNPCTTNDECTTAEGQVCDTMQTHTCILTGCATRQVTCPGYWACCDVGAIMPGFSICAEPSSLKPDGSCSFGTKVTP